MFKILIYPDSDHYGQYLKSLVFQAVQSDDFEIQITTQLNKKVMRHADLLVIEANPSNKLPRITVDLSNLPILVVAGSGKKIKSGPNLKILYKPLNGNIFINSIYKFFKKRGLCKDGFSPEEPYLIGNNPKIHELRKKIIKLSNTEVNLLVCGQTGTGKGVLARVVHNCSLKKNKPFLAVNCANLSAHLFERELPGYIRGAFTGARENKTGMFELAGEGTIFLDEISEMSPSMQAKLLHVLEEKKYYPVGGHENDQIFSRTIAATNSDLNKALEEKRFRADLYYRLAVVRLDMPLLRERSEDIPVLGQFFLDKCIRLHNKNSYGLSRDLWDLFKMYDWPGNVRELENTINALVATDNEPMIRKRLQNKLSGMDCRGTKDSASCDLDIDKVMRQNSSLKEVTDIVAGKAEAELIARALSKFEGNKKAAASALDVTYKCLLKKIKKYRV